MSYGISREEESKLPKFKSHQEAREYFKNIYGANFQLEDTGEWDGEKLYFYKLILDMETYIDMIEELKMNGMVAMNEKRAFCSQDIQISESGSVHIVH